MKYARARVALALGDGATALTKLDGLETALPALSEAILHARAEAHALAGPPADAGTYFATHLGNADDQLAAARAFVKAGDEPRAAKACAVVLGLQNRSARPGGRGARDPREAPDDARAHARRRRALARAQGAAILSFAAGADVLLAKHDAKHPLTAPELVARAHVLADAGKLDDALAALGFASALAPLDKKRAQADARMRARAQYTEAARLYYECAASKDGTAEDLLSSARALSRGDDDDAAITRYADVVKRYAEDSAGRRRRVPVGAPRVPARALGEGRDGARRLPEEVPRRWRPRRGDEAPRHRAPGQRRERGGAQAARGHRRRREGREHARALPRISPRSPPCATATRTHALARWTEVAKTYPLTWPALVARARLRRTARRCRR